MPISPPRVSNIISGDPGTAASGGSSLPDVVRTRRTSAELDPPCRGGGCSAQRSVGCVLCPAVGAPPRTVRDDRVALDAPARALRPSGGCTEDGNGFDPLCLAPLADREVGHRASCLLDAVVPNSDELGGAVVANDAPTIIEPVGNSIETDDNFCFCAHRYPPELL